MYNLLNAIKILKEKTEIKDPCNKRMEENNQCGRNCALTFRGYVHQAGPKAAALVKISLERREGRYVLLVRCAVRLC